MIEEEELASELKEDRKERGQARVVAAALEALGSLQWLSTALCLFCVFVAIDLAGQVVAITVMIWVNYCGLRTRFDAALFKQLAQDAASGVDAGLMLVLGRAAPQKERSVAARWSGTKRIIGQYLLSVFCSLVLLIYTICWNSRR